ncbi:MAG: GNAT family N-acetyltransferase [Eubacteriales bacterium]|nr:GNAT family N-acetyltransferase [Eubacteriales bacterium]MDD3883246.1 GNAT family N-acetyltransferase [Eubacteriales bacterium]MDD4512981.1 GNAT family N-acetyltransferase [Eubacteriales bacterium]
MAAHYRMMEERDRNGVIGMMRVFYASDAVSTNGSEEIFERDFSACVGDCPFVEGYVFIRDNETVGYSMVSKTYSTECGRLTLWLEDLYIRDGFRGEGIGGGFIAFLEDKYPKRLIRLEVEKENLRALKVYRKHGFTEISYLEMIKHAFD